jgi:hypothetical protein
MRIVFALVIAAVICQGAYLVAARGLRRFEVFQTERLTEIFVGTRAHDLLFLGSSRAQSGINPSVVDRSLGVDSYNAGMEGANLLEHQLTLAGYLATHPQPATVVLLMDVTAFNVSRPIWNSVQYYPYLQNEPLRRAMQAAGQDTLWRRRLPFLRMLDWDDYIRGNCLKGLLGKTELCPTCRQYKGYLDSGHPAMAPPDYRPATTMEISPRGVSALQSIIDTCRARGIRLVMVYSPMYRGALERQWSNSGAVVELTTAIAAKNQVPFWRHDRLPLCGQRELFQNPGHLDGAGADVYSAVLAQELRALGVSR